MTIVRGFAMLMVAAALELGGVQSAGAQDALEDYVVKPRDTCYSIAREHFGSIRRVDTLHRYNPGLGPSPHHLVPGQILHLPHSTAQLGPAARVTAVQRRVETQEAGREAWEQARIGLGLEAGGRVATREASSANLTLRNTTVVHLREDTLVIVHLAPAGATRSTGSDAHLERGTLRSRLGALAGGPPLRIETPSSTAELASGTALVSVDAGSATRLANHGGSAARIRSRTGGRAVSVPVGMGSKVEQGQRPTAPRMLPSTPVWASTTVDVLSLGGTSGVLTASWGAVPAAVRYRVEVTRDGEAMQAIEVDAPITQIEIRGLTPARHELVVASIDNDKFESIPSQPMIALVRAVGLVPPPLPDSGSGAIVLAPRTHLAASAGACTIDGAPLTAEAPIPTGTHTLSCAGEGGPSAPAAIDVAPFEARFVGTTAPEIVVGRDVEFVVEIDTGGRPLPELEAVAGAGLAIVSARREEARFTIVARATERNAAGTSGEISFRTTGDYGGTVGAVQLPFAAAPVEAPPPPPPGVLPPGSGGCAGCRVAPASGGSAPWFYLLTSALLFVRWRRGRRRSA